MIAASDNIIHKQRVVIAFQLGVLLFVLIGLFGQIAFTSRNTPNNSVDLSSVAVTKPAEQKWEQLTKTEVRARAAYVYDVNSGEVLFEKNATEPLPIASITKLMTSMLSYELVDQKETGEVSINALRQSGSSGLAEGEALTIRDLNELALVSSSNDAAFTIAATVGAYLGPNDPAAQFVAGMNLRAEELGLNTMKFKNPTGLDLSPTEPGAVGSAKDVSLLLSYLIKSYPTVIEPSTEPVARVYSANGIYHDAENTNDILYRIPNLIASKTGYTDLAGGNLTIAYDAGFNRPIVITVLGSTRQERFSDVIRLVEAISSDLEQQ